MTHSNAKPTQLPIAVMRMPDLAHLPSFDDNTKVHRKCAACEGEDEKRHKLTCKSRMRIPPLER